MSVSYDLFDKAFLAKISEFEILTLDESTRQDLVDGYMKRAIANFKKNCKYDFISTADDNLRKFDVDVNEEDIDELVEIISEGMVVQWMKPYINRQELLESVMNTRDYSTYSSAELLKRVGSAYKEARTNYTQMIREYSYNHGDLSDLHI